MSTTAAAIIDDINATLAGDTVDLSHAIFMRLSDAKAAAAHFTFGDAERRENRAKLERLVQVHRALGTVRTEDHATSMGLYVFYNLFCQLASLFFHPLGPALPAQTAETFKAQRFLFLGDKQRELTRTVLSGFWRALETCTATARFEVRLNSNYPWEGQASMPNQFFLSIPAALLDDVKRYVIQSGLAAAAESYFNSKVGVCNVRSWRYVHHQTAYVDGHRDKIGPLFLKAMIFPGVVTPEDGCFEFLPTDPGTWTQVIGDHPVVICDTQVLHHRALAPQPGHHRDVIELTFIPRFEDGLPVVGGGGVVGAPYNPFAAWTPTV